MDCQFHLPAHHFLEYRIRQSTYPVYHIGEPEVSIKSVDGPFGSDLKAEEYVDNGVPLVRVSNCRSGEILQDEELVYISEEKHNQLIRSEVLPGDVLLTKAGHILGYSAVFPTELIKGNITSHLAAIRPSVNVVPKFLVAYLSSSLGISQIYRWGNKATRPELNTDEVRQILISLPPLNIQQKLVDDLEAARASRKRKLAEADALLAGIDGFLMEKLGLTLPEEDKRQSYAVKLKNINSHRLDSYYHTPFLRKTEEAIRSLKVKLVELFALLQLPPLNGVDARDYLDTGQRYLRVQNVRPYELLMDDVKYVSSDSKKDVALKAGDVLLTRKGTFGVATSVPKEAEDCLISSEIILLRLSPDAACLSEYLVTWLNSSVAKILLDRYKTGGIMGHITQDVVSVFPVPVPPMETQQTIAAEITRRREETRRLRAEAAKEWEAAKKRFEQDLLG